MAITLLDDETMNTVVSHIDGVVGSVASEAEEIGARAEARLAPHTKSGAHHITVTHGEVDSFANLEGPAAADVEFGHWVKGKYETDPPKFAHGLYIISGAAGLAG